MECQKLSRELRAFQSLHLLKLLSSFDWVLRRGVQTALGIQGMPYTTHLLPRPAVLRAGLPTFTSILQAAMPLGTDSGTPYRSVANATVAVAGPDGLPSVGGLVGDLATQAVLSSLRGSTTVVPLLATRQWRVPCDSPRKNVSGLRHSTHGREGVRRGCMLCKGFLVYALAKAC